ncbi:S-layer homology domain-containing protein [Paenibacillus rigui]|uniref:SLH domain-containing protein n=1 Tax=Paenibacillus rigui TaxID=554312 RepID=A0A229UU61_9BACL|nr:S-layer homology domain-containing protein [Paenibacillus rigui]OXM87137.1 hypothetical protein CF651_05645 [Paenibacillus rigui]
MGENEVWKIFQLVCLSLVLTFTTMDTQIYASLVKTSADFKDLTNMDDITKAKIDKWLSLGLIQGVSEDQFGIKDTISRAEFAKIVALTVRLKIDTTLKKSSFIDVEADDLKYGDLLPYIEALRQAGITNGVDQDRFDPRGEVTKEQFAVFLIRSQAKDAEGRQTEGTADATVSPYAKGYVALALNLFPNLNSDGPYYGSAPITRQMVLLGLDVLTISY